MKVAVIASDRYPIAAPFAGGLESFTWYLANGLRERGIEVVLFAGPGSDPDLQAEEMDVVEVQLSEQARQDISMPPQAQVRETIAYLQVMRNLAGRADIDVVHNHCLHYLPIALAQTLPQPMLTTLHTPPTPWLESALRLTPAVPVTAVSHSVAQMWREITSAQVIHNGIDLDLWSYGDGGDELVWFGRIVPEKAPHLAARVAREAGMGLRIAGPIIDPEYFSQTLAPLLDDRIRLAGHLRPASLQELISTSAACLVTPGWDEPFGLVAAEAMACGTPVLAIGRGGLPEVVRPPGGHCVAPGHEDDQDVAALVERLPAVLQLERAQVRQHAERTCSLSDTIDRYIEYYEALASR